MRPRLLVLALPIVALCAACGSSSSTSSSPAATAATSANTICANANTKINAIVAPGNPATVTDAGQLPGFAAYIDQVTPLATQEQTDLAASPDGASVTATFGEVITNFALLDTAAKGTDVAAFQAESTKFTAANDAFHAAATAANMPDCAK